MNKPVWLALAMCAAVALGGCASGAANESHPAAKPSPAKAVAKAKRTPDTPQQSLAKLTAEIAAHPNDAALYTRRGELYHSIHNGRAATRDYVRAYTLRIASDPKDANLYLGRARDYMRLHERAKANRDFERAIALQSALVERAPTNPNVWLLRARTYAEMGNYDASVADITRAIDLEPQAAGYYLWRAKVYLLAEKLHKALDDCNAAVQMQPGNPLVWSDRGWVYASMGQNRKALADLNHAIKLDPSGTISFARRGFVYGALGNYAHARSDFDDAIRLDGKNPLGYGALAWLLATAPEPQLRNGADAIAYAKHAETLPGGGSPWVIAALAAGQAETGDFEHAIKTQDRALAETPAQYGALRKRQRELLADYRERKAFHAPFSDLGPVLPYIYARY